MQEAVETVRQTPMKDQAINPVHARPRIRHWAVVAAACGAVVVGALAATPAQGRPTPGPEPVEALPAAAAPDPAKAQLPLDCGPFPVTIALSFGARLDGVPSTVAAAHCAAPNGTPSDAVFLLTTGPDGRPAVRASLVTEADRLTFTELKLRSDGTIIGRAKGYSSANVPRFAPDLVLSLSWTRHGTEWTRTETKAPAGQV
ncbi:hypothetical protein [Kitasatospora sp. GP82]|uniref:hypothetical protein n=1 Tax=Kitasatospora sp. GP82 TaxID=3035089 RepID=UPI002473D5AD|nr:hypothetical protein [Kitasatospora sp. GP82]MDH6127089.1 hypothetical protein [Kitasatospora sp. GP82]